MRVLILNWRCPKHPKAGGAEILTQRIAERLVKWGHSITWFTAQFPSAPTRETTDGVEFIRRGSQTTVHWEAWRWYRQSNQGCYDVVIDEINTIPFFAPWYAETPTVAFIPQLAREVWWHEAPPLLAPLGYAAEPFYLQVYRETPVITISQSTKDSLIALGFKGPINIIPMATDFPTETSLPAFEEKEPDLTLIFIGRVVASKRVDHMIAALAKLRQIGISARLWVVGSGDPVYRARLEDDIQKYGLASAVQFLGKVSHRNNINRTFET